ncbi:probable serine/threonine-protein kinase DDB_G0267686 [Drosophila eugracilis]|uniref:probable serine/threonine-protein kinase DDB_G0267686 n=1 Tax=Drosophila eugracilis TaxID=29029 RepID=UPI001BDB4032|nr:probable serine/threonine-protein kinase DDB_G0267686 [Drosophila eugracilis]
MARTMDDMVFQCSNQNSIYVLNASYGAYGDYGTYAATKREINGSRSRAANPIEATCSSGVLQHKFKTFGSAASAATTAAAAAASPPTTFVDAAAGSASNYVNPVATSMSTAMCSPATAALQKLFNCSVGVACQNVTHSHSNHSSSSSSNTNSSNINNSNISSSHINGSNNNAAASNHNNRCLSAAGGVTENGRNRSRSGESLDGAVGVATSTGGAVAGGAGGLPLLPKKKCTNVKSALIAKKTKFLKYLEEEKWRSDAAVPEDTGAASNEAEPPTSNGNNNGGNLKNQSNSREAGIGGGAAGGGQLNKLTNWSMHNEDSNAALTIQQHHHQQQQQQQQQRQLQQQAKSSFELYQEAADILGLSCSLCDNCRCLDCQSGYFDCDDDDESYSEQSLMDDEYDEYDCSAEELQAVLTGPRDQERPRLPCCQLDSNNHPPHKGDSPAAHTLPESESLGHRVAIDFDLINATCSQVLENCETFNDLSLLDAAAGAERPFT